MGNEDTEMRSGFVKKKKKKKVHAYPNFKKKKISPFFKFKKGSVLK